MRRQHSSGPEQVPAHRRVPFTTVLVDAFHLLPHNPLGSALWALTHFHADHYGGLSARSFPPPSTPEALLLATPVTARLVQGRLGVPADRILLLEPHCTVALPVEATAELEAVAVTALDANHCPGSAMLLFEIRRAGGDTVRVLHSGDMRFAPKMRLFPELRTKEIHQLFLDTTYCNPKYVFPPQENMTIWIAEKVRTEWAKMPKALFVVGTYTIGKEKVLLEIRRLLGGAQQGTKVYANAEKRRILKMLQLVEPAEFESVFTGKEDQSRIHIVKLGELGFQNMDALCEKAKALGYQRIIGFKPTGWTFNSKKQVTETKKGIATVYGVPYSEHSNFEELKEFVKLVRPRKLIPTVNCESKVEREEMAKHFQSLMNHSSNPGKIANYFGAKKDRGDSRAREETLAKNPPSNTIQHQNLREPKRSKTEQANQQNILTYFVQK